MDGMLPLKVNLSPMNPPVPATSITWLDLTVIEAAGE
jgi:hypothetical protein